MATGVAMTDAAVGACAFVADGADGAAGMAAGARPLRMGYAVVSRGNMNHMQLSVHRIVEPFFNSCGSASFSI